MIKIIRTDEEIKKGFEEFLEENNLSHKSYNMEEMVEVFSLYVEECFSQFILDKYDSFYECGCMNDLENANE